MSGGQELVAEMLRRGFQIMRDGPAHQTHFTQRYLADNRQAQVTVTLSFNPANPDTGSRPTFAGLTVATSMSVPAEQIMPDTLGATADPTLRTLSREADFQVAQALRWIRTAFAHPIRVTVPCSQCRRELTEFYPGADGQKRCEKCHEANRNGTRA